MATSITPHATARRTAAVGILGLGRLGLLTALGLSAAGIGRLVLDDPGAVTRDDLGLGGYTLRDVGSMRRVAAARVVAESASAGHGSHPAPARPHDVPLSGLDALVVVTHEDLAPDRTWRLMGERVPHLVVRCSPQAVDISPLVVPGRTPCLRCVTLHAQDEDGTDAFTASTWRIAPHSAPGVTHGPAPTPDEPLLASAAAVVATTAVLTHIDSRGARSPEAPRIWETVNRAVVSSSHLALPDVRPREEHWPVHPRCGCTGQVAAPSSGLPPTA